MWHFFITEERQRLYSRYITHENETHDSSENIACHLHYFSYFFAKLVRAPSTIFIVLCTLIIVVLVVVIRRAKVTDIFIVFKQCLFHCCRTAFLYLAAQTTVRILVHLDMMCKCCRIKRHVTVIFHCEQMVVRARLWSQRFYFPFLNIYCRNTPLFSLFCCSVYPFSFACMCVCLCEEQFVYDGWVLSSRNDIIDVYVAYHLSIMNINFYKGLNDYVFSENAAFWNMSEN